MTTKGQKQKVSKRKSPVRKTPTVNASATLVAPLRAAASIFEHQAIRLGLAIIGWSFAVFLLLALVSYSSADPNIDHATATDAIHNWGGIVGAYIGGSLLRAFGVATYLLPLLVAVNSADLAWAEKRSTFWLRIPASALLLFTISALTAMMAPDFSFQAVVGSGWIGKILGTDMVLQYFGLGGVVLLLPILVVSFVGSIGTNAITVTWLTLRHMSDAIIAAGKKAVVSFNNAIRKSTRKRRENSSLKKQKEPDKSASPKFIKDPPSAPVDAAQQSSLPEDATLPDLEIDRPKTVEPTNRAVQRKMLDPDADYQQPNADLLERLISTTTDVDEKLLRAKAQILEHKIKEYGIDGRVTAVRPGPVISIYEFKPAPGVKVSKISNLEDDLALATESISIRIVAPIPGRDVVGIEIPNKSRQSVGLRELVESDAFWDKKLLLPFALGKDTAGLPVVADVATMPHALIAGATGSGKSVGVNSLIVSLLYRHSPRNLRLYLVDPKRLELSFYNDIPHLEGHDVVTDPHEAYALLDALVREMEDRYEWMQHGKVRNIASYNKAVKEGRVETKDGIPAKHMPFLVCIVDELADLMMVTRKAIEEPIARLAQMARAAGIHVILATQRPSVDVITGLIKANFPTRIAFKVSSRADARVVLDQQGAENLLGQGDMLFKPPTSDIPTRVHGAFVSEEEVTKVVDFWKAQAEHKGTPEAAVSDNLIQESLDKVRSGGDGGSGDPLDAEDEMFEKAVDAAAREGVVSTSRLQRLLGIGYNRAARIMDSLEARGMVGPPQGAGKPRKFLGSGSDS